MVKRPAQLIYAFEAFRLDVSSSMLYQDGREVLLPPKAVETLLALVERSGEIVPKDELMEIIWSDSIVEESNLSQYLHLLRKTLGNTSEGKPFIETLKRRGYRFNGKVSELSDEFSSPRRGAEFKTRLPAEKLRINDSNAGSRHVERHGNVLALVNWNEGEKTHAPKTLSGELTGARHVLDFISNEKSRRAYAVGVAVAMLVLATLSMVWFTSDTPTTPLKGDIALVNLTSGEDVNHATISPDGNYFVYTSSDIDKTHLWLQQTGQANRIDVISPITGIIYGATFTPDSQFIYFVAQEKPRLLVLSTAYRL